MANVSVHTHGQHVERNLCASFFPNQAQMMSFKKRHMTAKLLILAIKRTHGCMRTREEEEEEDAVMLDCIFNKL